MVTVAVSRVVSEIFNVKKYRNLEILVKVNSRSLKVVPFDRLGGYGFQLVFYSNVVPRMHCFLDIRLVPKTSCFSNGPLQKML